MLSNGLFEKIKRLKKTILRTLIISGVFSVSVFSKTAFAASDDLFLSMTYGYRNTAVSGKALPVKVNIINDSDEEISGKLSITLEDDDWEGNVSYSFDVNILAHSGSEVRSTVTLSENDEEKYIGLKLADTEGNILSERQVKLEIQGSGTQIMTGVLSEMQDELVYFRGVSPTDSSLRVKTIALREEDIPENSEGLEQLDMIIISGFNTAKLSEEKADAVLQWVKDGGVLLLGTGETDNPLGEFAAFLPDITISETELRDVNMGLAYSTDGPDGAMEMLYVRDIFYPRGMQTMQTDDTAMLTTISCGSGVIGITAYDLCDISDFCMEHLNYAEDLVTNLFGKTRLNSLSTDREMEINRYETVKPLVDLPSVTKLPNISLYVGIALIYVLFAGPWSYSILKERGLNIYYPLLVVIIAFVFTFIIFIVSSRFKFRYPSIRYASVNEKSEDSAERTTFIEMFSADGRKIELDADLDTAVHPVGESERTGKLDIYTADKEKKIIFENAKPFEKRIVNITDREEKKETVKCDISFYEEKLTGSIFNITDKKMENTVLLLNGAAVVIGDIGAAEEVKLNDKPVYIISPDDPKEILTIAGIQESDITNAGKRRLLSYYLSNRKQTENGKGLLLSFTDDREQVILIDGKNETETEKKSVLKVSDEGAAVGGCTLTAENVEINMLSGENIYRSVMSSEPKLISGNYNYAGNYIEGTATVLEYRLGSDLDINTVRFCSTEDTDSRITISIYNYTKGAYERLDRKKTVIEKEELGACLSPSNTILVRYFPDEEPENEEIIKLPMLNVTGVIRQ